MPSSKSAAKRMRTSRKSEEANKSVRARVSSCRRQLREAIAGGDRAKGEKAFRTYCSVLDKAAKNGTIKANNASRRKSRAAALLTTCA